MLKIGIRNGPKYTVGLVNETETVDQILAQQNINTKTVNVFVNGIQISNLKYGTTMEELHKTNEMIFVSVKNKFLYE